MPHGGRYSETSRPRTPWGRLHFRWRQRRIRAQMDRRLADGRDYTGWTALVVRPHDSDGYPPVGSRGAVTESEGVGSRRQHYIRFPGGMVLATELPSRHIELIPPAGTT